ncbi:MAG TPA: MazG family protein [Anaerolineae bacterium]|nr:MazG family protein [Anaerolineae bacterium]
MKTIDVNGVLKELKLDPLEKGLQLIGGEELAADAFPRIDTDRPALVFQLDAPDVIHRAAQTLRVNYPKTHPITILNGKRQEQMTLDELPDASVGRNAVLYIPPLPYASSPLTLANIMGRLRAPNGCPWDREQTHESITRALIEETYEVIEAISDKDMTHLKEELGDLWLHVLFQTQIARDENEFRLSEVGAELAAKLIRRHPHVFGDVQAANAAEVLKNWEVIKQQEKKDKGQTAHASALDSGIPRELPALTRAQKVQERARRKKLQAANGKRPSTAVELGKKISRARNRERVVGELLLELAGIAEKHGIDAERALRAATKEYVQEKSDGR